MGLGLSLYTVAQLARETAPTFAEALAGRVTRERCDERIQRFSRRVVDRAEMDLEVTRLSEIPAGGSYVLMSNHQSHIDIPVIYATAPVSTLRMVAKTELFRIPMWGRAMRAAEMIEVDRRDRSQAVASLSRAADRVSSGVSIWIAPEGSRSRTGEVAPLKKGGFHLAKRTGAPIVPIAITGTRDVLPPGARAMHRGQSVRVVYGRPIATEGASVEELRDEVAHFLATHVGKPREL